MKQNQYELTYLIDPRTSEDTRNSLNSAVDAQITALEGTITHQAEALRKKLAYKVGKQDLCIHAYHEILNYLPIRH